MSRRQLAAALLAAGAFLAFVVVLLGLRNPPQLPQGRLTID